MSDLRNKLIRLAHQKPELRPHLLPLLKSAAPPGEAANDGKVYEVMTSNPQASNEMTGPWIIGWVRGERGSAYAIELEKVKAGWKRAVRESRNLLNFTPGEANKHLYLWLLDQDSRHELRKYDPNTGTIEGGWKSASARKVTAMPNFQRLRGKLPLGRTVATRGVDAEMRRDPAFAEFVAKSMTRHANGDWGDLDSNDRKMNDEAMRTGEDRIMSVYKAPGMKTIWIITEWDRSATTVLFPSEY